MHYRLPEKPKKWFLSGFKCKLGTKCDENIQNLPDAPNFCYFTCLQVSLVGSVSIQNSAMASDMILNASDNVQQAKKMVFKSFQLQFGATFDNFLHLKKLHLEQI